MNKASKDFLAKLLGASVILTFVALAVIGAIFGVSYLGEFLKGAASGWVQAVGSIGAIAGAYHFGEIAHKNQVRQEHAREERAKLIRVTTLREIFRDSYHLDERMVEACKIEVGIPFAAEIWDGVYAKASLQVELILGVPLFEVPDHELAKHLSMARTSAVLYREHSQTFSKKSGVKLDVMTAVLLATAADGMNMRQEAIQHCDELGEEIRLKIDRLSSFD